MRFILGIIVSFYAFQVLAQSPEKDIPSAFDHIHKYEQTKDIKLAYYELGSGDPVLFLHGIPDNSYLWRNVVPLVAKENRAIALDLVGYGKSDFPKHNDYSIQRHYEYIEGFIENLNLKNITLVVTDIGSFYGLKYAIEHPENIKGVAFIEAMYMPSKEWYKSLKFMQKMMFTMMKNENRAHKMLVEKNKMPSMMLKMAVVSKPSEEVKQAYEQPFAKDLERRKIMLYGPGPHTLPKKGVSQKKGDFADELNTISEGLKLINASVPFLIIHAEPGMIVRKKNLEYAKEYFKNVAFFNVGKGKHYLTEDHPRAIGAKILDWTSGLK